MDNLVKNDILGVNITNDSTDHILKYLMANLEKSFENFYIVTPNPEIIMFSQRDASFKEVLNEACIALCDGVGVSLAGKILDKPFVERITGIDFMKSLCKEVSNRPITVGFLGGRKLVAEMTAKCLKDAFPGLKVVFTHGEWDNAAMQRVAKLKIDILFVAFGFPKQEIWMSEHINKIPVRIMMGVGGSFDYISGRAKRAPRFLRISGFEWMYRLVHQPWRWKRQLVLSKFILLVLKQKYTLSLPR